VVRNSAVIAAISIFSSLMVAVRSRGLDGVGSVELVEFVLSSLVSIAMGVGCW